MKKQIITATSAHTVRAAFLLILPFLLGPPMHQALGQGNASKRSVAANMSQVAPSSTGAITGTYGVPAKPAPKLPAIGQSQFPTPTSGAAGTHPIIVLPMPKAPQVVLYDQYNNPNGTSATLSATFTDFPTFSSDLADDFVVPAGQTWNVQSIDADGVYFNGQGPATSWNVFIYADSAGFPGMQIFSATNQPVTQVGTTFTVNLPAPAVLTAGTYWVEIQANMTFGTQGEWGWTDRTVTSNNAAAFQNPGGGLGVCPTWGRRGATCGIDPGAPDQVYRLNGTMGGGGTCTNYTFTTGTGTFVPGVTDTGNHCDDCITPITLPFPVTLYDQMFTTANVGSNGALFLGTANPTFGITCSPLGVAGTTYTMGPYWDDQRTDTAGSGIFTTTTGTAPNRVFYVEYRATYFNTGQPLNYEIALYENGTPPFKYIYNSIPVKTSTNDSQLVVGVKKDDTTNTQYGCDPTGGENPPVSSGQALTASCGGGGGGCNGSKIYDIAGFGAAGQTNTTRIYDVGTNTWTTGAPLPDSLSDLATAYWNGKIYVAGGYNGAATSALYIYDIAGNSWTTGAPMPAALYLPGFGIINGKFYIASGNNGSTEVNTLYIYDIASNTWSTGPVVPTPVTGPGSAVYQGKLYLFGGAAPFPTTITTTQIYDPVANSWSSGPAMNVARLWFYGGAVDATSIVAPGGDNSPGIPINDNEQLTSTWAIKAPVPYAARGPFAVSDGTFVYIGGGYDGSTIHADLLRYDPVANTYTPLASSPDVHFLSQAVLVNCAPAAQSAFSRKVHGGAGTFDIPLPLTGNVGVECRTGPTYQMIINFATNVTVQSASVTSGTGMVSSFTGSGTPTITVNLSGVTDQQRITMTLHNVNNGTVTGDVPISMGVLIGDVNGNGAVSASDVALTKSQVGATVGGSNFREDVNVNGTISSTDVALVKSDVGHALPP